MPINYLIRITKSYWRLVLRRLRYPIAIMLIGLGLWSFVIETDRRLDIGSCATIMMSFHGIAMLVIKALHRVTVKIVFHFLSFHIMMLVVYLISLVNTYNDWPFLVGMFLTCVLIFCETEFVAGPPKFVIINKKRVKISTIDLTDVQLKEYMEWELIDVMEIEKEKSDENV